MTFLISRSEIVKVHSLHQLVIVYVTIQLQIITCMQMHVAIQKYGIFMPKDVKSINQLQYENFKCS